MTAAGISRLYNFSGELYVRHGNDGHNAFNFKVPDMTFEEGLKKISKLPGVKLLDLSKM